MNEEILKEEKAPRIKDKNYDVEHSIIKKYRGALWAKFVQAVDDYKLIQEGDKVAVCMSGGKDSFLLAKLFQELQKHWLIKFECIFLCMDPGYNEKNRKLIEDNAKLLNIPLEIFETNIFDSVDHIEDSPCYICARMRRGYLYREAQKRGCNKIALGHHFDDVIETTMLSILYGSQVQTMVPKIRSTNVLGMELIRPMFKIHEEDIIRWVNGNELQFINCACKLTSSKEEDSKRKEIKNLIKELKKNNPIVDTNIFKAMENVNLNMTLGYKRDEHYHDFLDLFESEEKSFDYEKAFQRQIALIGEENQIKLKNSHVLVFGIGGVGGHAIDALVRSGIGHIDIVDKDVVDLSNLNRQIIANLNSVGRKKTTVMKEHIASINPTCVVHEIDQFMLKDTDTIIDYSKYDYVVDCIDTVTAKIDIIVHCNEHNVKVISSMGTARKMDPKKLEVTDIYKTSVCPLAKVMRHELKTRNINKCKVVYSKEEPIVNNDCLGSVSFVPSVAGLLIASEVVKDLINGDKNE